MKLVNRRQLTLNKTKNLFELILFYFYLDFLIHQALFGHNLVQLMKNQTNQFD
jgi:hypothetical protein